MRPCQTDRPHEPGKAVRVVIHGEGLRRIRGSSTARSVPSDDVKLVIEAVELRAPGSAVESKAAMEKDEWFP